MVEKIPFVLTNPSGEKIAGDFRYPMGMRGKPVVVILHSFMAFKDWGWFPYIAENIAGAGFATVMFNFSRNGVGENPNRITEFESFQRNTITHEREDTRVVLEAINRGVIGNGVIDAEKIILLGHSRGGGIAIATSAERLDVKGLITLSSVSTFDRWTTHQKELWRKLGFLPLARDSSASPPDPAKAGRASPLRLGLNLLDDVEKNKEKLDIIRAASKLHMPWVIIHGTEDLMVRFSEAEQLYAAADKTMTEFVPMKQVGHIYGGAEVIPLRKESFGQSGTIHHVVDLTIHWLQKHFSLN